MRLRKKHWIKTAIEQVINKTLLVFGMENCWERHDLLDGRKPVVLEVGSGKGKFIVSMAEHYPDKYFVALENQQDVAFYPAFNALNKALENLKVLLMDAQNLTKIFSRGDVSEIYLNFSDPWPKSRHSKRRLTYRTFLAMYRQILQPKGSLCFKTDNRDLFDFTLGEMALTGVRFLKISTDLHNSHIPNEIQTEYEEKFSAKGNNIYYVEIQFL